MKNNRKAFFVTLGTVLTLVLVMSPIVKSHCEIPCGIYGDSMRIDMMFEHVQTIEKSINEINEISKAKDKNYNQLVRWTINKENHADELSNIVTQYFMKQRIKPAEKNDHDSYDAYVNKLTLLHQIMIYSMKCKQTTDLENVDKLRNTVTQFKNAYMGMDSTEHSH